MEFIEYAKCSTCKRAKKFLDDRGIKYIDRSIKEEIPTYSEIDMWVREYNVSLRKLFNTSGLRYRELSLKDRLNGMSDEEKIRLLSSDGMLIKRPLLVSEGKVLIGFKEQEWIDFFEGGNLL